MKKIPLAIGALFFAIAVALAWFAPRPAMAPAPAFETLAIDGVSYRVEIASIPAQQKQGLSGRASLRAGSGMLFVFAQPDTYSFWMKDMQFPLDLIWIRSGKIIDIKAVLPPEGAVPAHVYRSAQPADAAVEINAGQAAVHHFKIGDAVEITP